jgi:hypothetical protein
VGELALGKVLKAAQPLPTVLELVAVRGYERVVGGRAEVVRPHQDSRTAALKALAQQQSQAPPAPRPQQQARHETWGSVRTGQTLLIGGRRYRVARVGVPAPPRHDTPAQKAAARAAARKAAAARKSRPHPHGVKGKPHGGSASPNSALSTAAGGATASTKRLEVWLIDVITGQTYVTSQPVTLMVEVL